MLGQNIYGNKSFDLLHLLASDPVFLVGPIAPWKQVTVSLICGSFSVNQLTVLCCPLVGPTSTMG